MHRRRPGACAGPGPGKVCLPTYVLVKTASKDKIHECTRNVVYNLMGDLVVDSRVYLLQVIKDVFADMFSRTFDMTCKQGPRRVRGRSSSY